MSTNSDRLDAGSQPDPSADRSMAERDAVEAPSTTPIDEYGNLTPEQTRTLAAAFIERMRGLNDDTARKYAALHPDQVLPSQLHEMHRYLSYNHPEVLREIMAEPQVASVLDGYAGTERERTGAQLDQGDQQQTRHS